MFKLSDTTERKFTDIIDASDWLVETDTGWEEIEDVKKTVPYESWIIELENGATLEGADTHILFNESLSEVFIKDLSVNDFVMTESGAVKVKSVVNTGAIMEMYDIGVKSENHRFYSNGILSHNSTTAAGYLLWYAMFVPDSTILVAAHKFLGAQEIMQRIRYAYEMCPDFIRAGVINYNKGSIEFENGSRIVSQTTTENTGRGMSISLLYLDEFAFVRPTIAREFWTSISPTLSTGGKALITSTPNSDEDQFAHIWKQACKTTDAYGNETELGVNGFKAYMVQWNEHPERDQTWADEERGRIGDERFRREHQCEFLIDDDTLINSATLSELTGTDPILKQGQIRWYQLPQKGKIYCVALDPSLGTGRDPAAIQIFEANTTAQIGEWRHNATPIPAQIRLLVDIVKYIHSITNEQLNIYYSVENNGIGEAAIVSLMEFGEENIPGIFLSDPYAAKSPGIRQRKGFGTSNKSKLAACAKLKNLIESRRMKIRSKPLISELKTFVALGNTYAARVGETDDLVMSTVLVVRMLQYLQNYHKELLSQVKDHLDEEIPPMPFVVVF